MVNLTNLEGFVVKNNIETIYVSSTSPKLICNPKGHSSLVLVRMCPAAEFESRLIQIPIFPEKVIHSYTNRTKFTPNFEQNYPIFSKDFFNLIS